LRELERWLGASLFDRRGGARSFIVTPTGQRLAVAVLGAMNDLRGAVDAVREQRSRHAVTLSTTPSFASRWLLPRLAAFERAHPHIEISILVEQRLDDLRASGCDLAIRLGRGPWQHVDSRRLMNDELYPVVSRSAWEKAGRPRTPTDLGSLRLLHDRDPNTSWALWRDAHGPEGLQVRKGPRFTSSDLVLRAAAQGLGVALARHRLVADEVHSGALVRPFGSRSVVLDDAYWIVTPPGRIARDATKIVIVWLHREAKRQT
jgi:LysR family glycine cleavage system transcriptional activator